MIMAAPLPRMLWQKEHTRFPLTDLDAGWEWEGGFHPFQTSHLKLIQVLTWAILYERLYISTGGKLSPANQSWLDYIVPWRISTMALVPLTPSYRNEWFLSSVHSAISLRPHLSSARFSCPSNPGKPPKHIPYHVLCLLPLEEHPQLLPRGTASLLNLSSHPYFVNLLLIHPII